MQEDRRSRQSTLADCRWANAMCAPSLVKEMALLVYFGNGIDTHDLRMQSGLNT